MNPVILVVIGIILAVIAGALFGWLAALIVLAAFCVLAVAGRV